jgi:hypothetical protein
MVETLLAGSSPLLHGGHANAATIPLLGRQSVFLAEGETHQQRRRLIGDAFAQGTEAVAERGAALLEGDVAGWPASRPFPLVLRMRSLLLRAHLPLIVEVGDEHRRRALERRVVAMLSPLAALGVLAPRPLERSRWPPARLFAARRGLVRALVVEEIRERRRRRDWDHRASSAPSSRAVRAAVGSTTTPWPKRSSPCFSPPPRSPPSPSGGRWNASYGRPRSPSASGRARTGSRRRSSLRRCGFARPSSVPSAPWARRWRSGTGCSRPAHGHGRHPARPPPCGAVRRTQELLP